MKRSLLTIFLVGILSLPTFGLSEEEIQMLVTRTTIIALLQTLDGTRPMQGVVQTSPGTFLGRGNGINNTERTVVWSTSNHLGVVSVTVVEDGIGARRNFDILRTVLNRDFSLQNTISETNNLRGILVHEGRTYRFTIDYTSRQKAMAITRQF